MQKITPCLWFDNQAEAAANFYTSLIPNSRIGKITPYGKAGAEAARRRGEDRTADSVMTVDFELDGQKFVGLNGGPVFKFTEAVSFQISCKDQAEVDKYWNALTADGGAESMCGWLKDKFGLSWQIIPEALPKLLNDPDEGRASRAMACMLKMKKLDVVELEKAAAGK